MNLTRITTRALLLFTALVMIGGILTHPVQAAAASSGKTPCETGSTFCFKPEIPIPGSIFNDTALVVDNSLLANYVRAIFIYFIWVVGIIATVMVIYGGIRWVAAAGNAGQIKEARDIVDNAIIGVIIALCSVVLLNIINPKLTHLTLPTLATVEKSNFCDITKTIPIPKFTGDQDFFVCPTSQTIKCGEAKYFDYTDPVTHATTSEVCRGTLCNPQQYSNGAVCQFLYDKTQTYLGACVHDIKYQAYDNQCNKTSVHSIRVASRNDVISNKGGGSPLIGVFQNKGGLGDGNDYISALCPGEYQSGFYFAELDSRTSETKNPYLNAPALIPCAAGSCVNNKAHTRLFLRGCPEADTYTTVQSVLSDVSNYQ